MAFCINKVSLLGSLGRDPEVKEGKTGVRVCKFSIATSDGYKNKAGEWVNSTEWHNIVIFNPGLVAMAEKNLHKGSKVYIEGSIKTSKYTDKNGVERTNHDIALMPYKSELICLDERPKSGGDNKKTEDSKSSYSDVDLDDEIPF